MKSLIAALFIITMTHVLAIEQITITELDIREARKQHYADVADNSLSYEDCIIVNFDLPDNLSKKSWIEFGYLALPIHIVSQSEKSETPFFDIYMIAEDVDVKKKSSNLDANCMTGDNRLHLDFLPDEKGYLLWDITDVLIKWIRGHPNSGLMIVPRGKDNCFRLFEDPIPYVKISFIRDIAALY